MPAQLIDFEGEHLRRTLIEGCEVALAEHGHHKKVVRMLTLVRAMSGRQMAAFCDEVLGEDEWRRKPCRGRSPSC